jgi:hypothetical protein
MCARWFEQRRVLPHCRALLGPGLASMDGDTRARPHRVEGLALHGALQRDEGGHDARDVRHHLRVGLLQPVPAGAAGRARAARVGGCRGRGGDRRRPAHLRQALPEHRAQRGCQALLRGRGPRRVARVAQRAVLDGASEHGLVGAL